MHGYENFEDIHSFTAIESIKLTLFSITLKELKDKIFTWGGWFACPGCDDGAFDDGGGGCCCCCCDGGGACCCGGCCVGGIGIDGGAWEWDTEWGIVGCDWIGDCECGCNINARIKSILMKTHF